MRLKALSVNSVVMEGNVPTKAQKNNLSSALIYILVQTLCSGFMFTLEVCINYQTNVFVCFYNKQKKLH